ncbi:hypothetical protein FHR21_002338 [Sphingopyxis panaciterrulae]|uniref:GLUG domain-containing protein n=1 Tax=Sphingopyxis panaciterrulae TaxID=462372 RepID=A0A7W9B653_9SPHN|nr:hypothetical protein [Sphingopyxis panaciterrulae]
MTSAGAAGWVWAGVGTRPFLAWEVPTAPAGGGPAVIRNAHQLQLINAGDLNGNYVLANDIDLTADLAAAGGKYPGMWSEAGFVPLGTNGRDGFDGVLNSSKGFAGQFDGRGYAIAGLVINRPLAYYVGLFGFQGGGTISRIGLTGGSVIGHSDVGGLVGYQQLGSIDQSYSTSNVSGRGFVGGLIGFSSHGSIAQSYAAGSVSGDGSVGGLVGGAERRQHRPELCRRQRQRQLVCWRAGGVSELRQHHPELLGYDDDRASAGPGRRRRSLRREGPHHRRNAGSVEFRRHL